MILINALKMSENSGGALVWAYLARLPVESTNMGYISAVFFLT